MHGDRRAALLHLRFHTCNLEEISCVIRAMISEHYIDVKIRRTMTNIHQIPHGQIHRYSSVIKFLNCLKCICPKFSSSGYREKECYGICSVQRAESCQVHSRKLLHLLQQSA